MSDVVRCVLAAAVAVEGGQTYHVGEPTPHRLDLLIRQLAEAMDRRVRIVRVPPVTVSAVARVAGSLRRTGLWKTALTRDKAREACAAVLDCEDRGFARPVGGRRTDDPGDGSGLHLGVVSRLWLVGLTCSPVSEGQWTSSRSASTSKDAETIRGLGLYPYFRTISSGQDPVVTMDGSRVIMLGSNNYLGLTNHPEVKEAAARALATYGTGTAGSRFLNGTLDIHVELEERLAEFMKREAALTFSTGFQVNLGAISSLVDRQDVVDPRQPRPRLHPRRRAAVLRPGARSTSTTTWRRSRSGCAASRRIGHS